MANVLNCLRWKCQKCEDSELSQSKKNLTKMILKLSQKIKLNNSNINSHNKICSIVDNFNIFFRFLIAWKMEIDDIFPRRIFSSNESAHAKILTEWKTASIVKIRDSLLCVTNRCIKVTSN